MQVGKEVDIEVESFEVGTQLGIEVEIGVGMQAGIEVEVVFGLELSCCV